MEKSSWDSYSDGMLVNLLLIIGGVFAVVWFSTHTAVQQKSILESLSTFTTLIAGQPGVFLSVWLMFSAAKRASKETVTAGFWIRRVLMVLIVFGVMCVWLPLALQGFFNQASPEVINAMQRATGN